MRNFLFFVFFVIVWVSFYGYAVALKSETLSSGESKKRAEKMIVGGETGIFKKNYTKFSGEAYVIKGFTEMKADEIEYFELTNIAYGYGNVILSDKSNGLVVKGGRSVFYGNENVIEFFVDPILEITNENITLKGEKITLSQSDSSVFAESNSFVKSENFEAYANKIYIYSSSNFVRLIGDSTIFSSNMVVKSDSGLVFFTSKTNKGKVEKRISKYMGIGDVFISNSQGILNSEKIIVFFDENNSVSEYVALGEVTISNETSVIACEYFRSVFDNEGKDILHIALTNVMVRDMNTGDVVKGKYLMSDKVKKYEVITENASFYSKANDTTVNAEVIERFSELRLVYLKKDVVISTPNADITGDFAIYDEINKSMEVFGNPKVVRDDKLGLSANVIILDLKSNEISIRNGNYGYVVPGM